MSSSIPSPATWCWPARPAIGPWAARAAIVPPTRASPSCGWTTWWSCFRHMMSGADAKFGCLITPRQEALAKAQEFLEQWSQPGRPGRAPPQAWLEQFRSHGRQAGHRGLWPGPPHPRRANPRRGRLPHEARRHGPGAGRAGRGQLPEPHQAPARRAPPPMGVLRWWFTLELRRRAGLQGPPGLRHPRPGREGGKRERTPHGPGPTGPHRPVGDAQPAVRPQLHRALRGAVPASIRSTPSCGTCATWPWPPRWCARRVWPTRSAGT